MKFDKLILFVICLSVASLCMSLPRARADDHGDDFISATAITVGTVTPGQMELSGDSDYFKFTVSQTGVYVIYSRNFLDVRAYLYSSSYAVIASDTDSGEVDNFRIERTLNPGTYFLRVQSHYSSETGDYEVWIEGPGAPLVTDDHGFSWHSATEISVGTVTPGEMELPGDMDYFKFTVSQTGVYVIYSRNFLDVRAYLYSSSYAVIASDTDSGEVDNFRIEWTLNPGTYFLRVQSHYSSETGDYEIWIEGPGAPLVTDDHGFSWHSATEILVGTVTPGEMELPGDMDYFKFTVSQTGVYVIYSRNFLDVRAYLCSSSYAVIASDTDSGEVDNFRIEQTLNPGTYFLRIQSHYSSETGDYEVWIEGPGAPLITDDHGFSWHSATEISLSTVTPGEMELPGDIDYFKFTVSQTGVYVIYSRNFLDVRAYLCSSSYAVIASDTDSGEVDNFRIEQTLNPGTYFLRVLSHYSSETGDYQIWLEDPDHPIVYGPHIFQTPPIGPPGTTFIQRGAGFTPNNTVTLHFRNHLGEELPSLQAATNEIGTFEIVYNSPMDKPEGTHTWWAVDDTSGERSKSFAYAIIVNPGQTTSIIMGQTQPVPQTNLNEKFGELIPAAGNYNFKADQDTFVIVHGWNRTESTLIPGWMALMGAAIANDSSAQGSNVYYWNWQAEAKSPNPEDWLIFEKIPYGKVSKSGENLAKQLNDVISQYPGYDCDIHLIGHSLGSGVIAFATKYLYENKFSLKNKIKHLTMLDSPWILDRPGGHFLRDNEDNFFFDNYFSAVGKVSGYWEADANIYLIKSLSTLINMDIYGDPHGYSYEWYRSSVTNFSDPAILNDLTVPPTTIPYGFYWWDENNHDSVLKGYIQGGVATGVPHWFLKSFDSYRAAGTIVDTAYYTGEIAEKTLEELNDFADRSGKKIKLLSVNTFNTVSDTADYVKDELSHAFQEAFPCNGIACGVLRLEHRSDSTATAEIQIPALANAMIFGFDFQYAAPGTVIEAFIEDQLLFSTYSHDEVGKGYQLAPWIDISQFAGTEAPLTFRISNPDAATEGAVRIDDLIFARIENQLFGDIDEDCDVDGSDLAMFASVFTGEGVSNVAFEFGTRNCGVAEPLAIIVADLNNDRKVDIFDYNIFMANYGQTDCGNVADLDGDCDVDIFDYNIFMAHYGEGA